MQTSPSSTQRKLNPVTSTVAVNRPTILCVDDEERILRSLRMLFAQTYNVRVTTDGNEALQILQQEKIHVLISDQRMPGMTGVELLRRAKYIVPNTMRLLLTGYSDLDSTLGSINEGEVFRFINKPWDADAIKATVASAVDIALSLGDMTLPAPSANSTVTDHILVIDEDPLSAVQVRELVHEHISAGLVIHHAATIEDVLEALRQHEIAVVVSEVRIGTADVTTLIKLLKRFNPRTVSILLTTFYDASMLVTLINEAQVYRCIPKPIRAKLLLRAIEGALESYWSFQVAPSLVKKHEVEVSKETTENPLASRIVGFFKSFSAQRT